MLEVKVEIVRFVDEYQPGVVECKLIDAWGCQHTFIDKLPYFTAANLWTDSAYPQPGFIACLQIDRQRDLQGREIITIDTEQPLHVETISGQTRFDVLPEQLMEDSG